MDAMLQQMIDREAIRACLARLARGEDRRSAELIRQCWWPDARFDYGVHSGDVAAYLAWVVPGAREIRDTQHMLGQTHMELSGETATAETHVFSHHRIDTAEGARDTCVGGRYLDRFEMRADSAGTREWRIAERSMMYDWSQDWGRAADWSQGIMGYPFSGAHFAGTAISDFSEHWFSTVTGEHA